MTVSSPSTLAVTEPKAAPDLPDGSNIPAQEAPFFIVGCGRSGTTLLRIIMMGHSRLYIPPETHFIRFLVADFPLDKPLTADQVKALVDRIVGHARWKHMGIPADTFRAQALAIRSPRLVDVLNLIYHAHLMATGKVRFGDKTPDYVRIIPQLLTIYPDARFVQLIRDGHDVAMSFAEQGWGQAYHGKQFEWSQAVHAAIAYRTAPFADRILEVRYEQMVQDLEGTVRRICDFLGETFEPDMLNWHDRIDLLFPGESPTLHPKIYQPLLPDAAGAWRRRLSTVECFLMEASIHRDLRLIGYDLRFASIAWRPLLASTGAVMRLLGPMLDRLIPPLRRRKYLRRPLYI